MHIPVSVVPHRISLRSTYISHFEIIPLFIGLLIASLTEHVYAVSLAAPHFLPSALANLHEQGDQFYHYYLFELCGYYAADSFMTARVEF